MTPEHADSELTIRDEALLDETHTKLMNMLVETFAALDAGDISEKRGSQRIAKIGWLLHELARARRTVLRERQREGRERSQAEAGTGSRI